MGFRHGQDRDWLGLWPHQFLDGEVGDIDGEVGENGIAAIFALAGNDREILTCKGGCKNV